MLRALKRSVPRTTASMPAWMRPTARSPRGASVAGSSGDFRSFSTQHRPNVQLQVWNPAAPTGQLACWLPLPGKSGLTEVQVNREGASVEELRKAIRTQDPSLRNVEIRTEDGAKIARSLSVQALVAMRFIVQLDDVCVRVQHDGSMDELVSRHDSAAFASVKQQIVEDARPWIPLREYYKMCEEVGASEVTADQWLRELQRRDLVAHFDHARHRELQQALLLRPNSQSSQHLLQDALDASLNRIQQLRQDREQELLDLESQLSSIVQVDHDAHKIARRLPNAEKWLALGGITSVYGALMYLVWDVYSWDVMEPITYFLGLSTVLAGSFHHSITKQDPTFANLWQKRFAQRLARVYKKKHFDPTQHAALMQKVEEIKQDIAHLTQLEGKTLQ